MLTQPRPSQPGCQPDPVPRRQRRQAARAWLKLGRPALEGSAPLTRGQRRRHLRELAAAEVDERQTLAKAGLLALGAQMALHWLQQAMEDEADALCGGPKGRHNPQRSGHRHGYEVGSVVVGGQRVAILRPRVRAAEGEQALSVYAIAQDERFLCEAVMMQTIAGVGQRRYGVTLGGVSGAVAVAAAVGSDSKSAVSRRFVAESQDWLSGWLARDLSGERYLALMVDGVQLGSHHVIAALGVTAGGQKQVLGLWQGGSESTEVCRALLEDLVGRGLEVAAGLLVVIDGGKGLACAVQTVLGDRVLVQRCVCHKARNLEGKLPQHRREAVHRILRQAWSETDAVAAERQLRALIGRLAAEGQVAAAHSLQEGLEQTLTCVRLGLHPDLRASLESTNLIESAFSRDEAVTHRVKRWRNGNQALRWTAVALALAEQGFSAIRGAEHLADLAVFLGRHASGVAQLRASA
jgi:putative transposase